MFAAEDGIGPLASLYDAGDALVAVAKMEEREITILGSGVMVGPGLLLTATHVIEECMAVGAISPVFLTFLPGAARAWLPQEIVASSVVSKFDETRDVISDLSLISCTLNSAAYETSPLMLAPMQIALPLVGQRLWALGFRHQRIEDGTALVSLMVSLGLVTAVFPCGRGERMISPCCEVEMDVLGGMSGGPVLNSDGLLVGIVSSSFDGRPSYITLIWDAFQLNLKGTVPKLARHGKTSLLHARAMGLVKVKGQVSRNPWGDVKFVLSDAELRLLARSTPLSARDRKAWPEENELKAFVGKWGAHMEAIAGESTIAALEKLSSREMRKFLRSTNVPWRCLRGFASFSVLDFGGIQDLEIIRMEHTVDQISIELSYELAGFLWTIRIPQSKYQGSESIGGFVFLEMQDDIVVIEVMQKGYFKARIEFDQTTGQFSNFSILSVALERPRSQRMPSVICQELIAQLRG
ncbi:serine protease [Mesorhizobium sp. B4-1-3]|uniref:trypsin-like serine peptidase n=1 Tax=Mesorhizobium sp. B4-1-3 TaxID=2589889 RepID=UPI001AEEAE42|nr:serine protease [Mesorhizobium sp. B4-1-3]